MDGAGGAGAADAEGGADSVDCARADDSVDSVCGADGSGHEASELLFASKALEAA